MYFQSDLNELACLLSDQVQRYDPTYEATRLHFEDLARRYGNPIIILNLIKVCAKLNLVASRKFTLCLLLK